MGQIGLIPQSPFLFKSDQPDRLDRSDQPNRPDRPAYPNRPECPNRPDRPEPDLSNRSDWPDRSDRFAKSQKLTLRGPNHLGKTQNQLPEA